MRWLKRIFSNSQQDAERRRYPRYPVSAHVEVDVAGRTMECVLDNVSAGGIRLRPGVSAAIGETVTVRHAASGLSLPGHVVGLDDGGTRVKFDSEDAGIVVSSWLRMAQEAGGREGEGGGR